MGLWKNQRRKEVVGGMRLMKALMLLMYISSLMLNKKLMQAKGYQIVEILIKFLIK